MSTEELLDIEPPVLSFPFELHKQAYCSIRLSNKTQKFVAFKVKTTSPTKYSVKPNFGIVSPRSTLDITVTMPSQKEAPPSMQCEDKFLIQSAVASSGATTDVRRLFERGHLIQNCKLEVVYIFPPQVPSSVPDGLTRARKLLDVKPLVLQFPFELNKELSCSFQLSNVTENSVAFKVKTTALEKYYVIPNMGIVLPRSTCDITVKMKAQNKVPPDVKCNDKFLIQSIVANTAATPKDITTDMFNKAEECKLTVGYVFRPHPPSTKSVTSKEGSSWNTSTMEKRNSNDSEVVPGHDRNGSNGGDVILGWIIIGLLGMIIWYIMKMAMPLIGYCLSKKFLLQNPPQLFLALAMKLLLKQDILSQFSILIHRPAFRY
ncbi:Vesicle-associated protein 1-4 [Abeliophyllum distichum]|uniref:Vesicle-associated protein 1-4 n=1 Tax=Abeliophyllum distichum TaxID=126358 RepID=A0ABD1QAE2_9LAMI